ncbi:C40 family peptidase [Bacillus sp. P14.5]|uniref:C40 family peptidase n=1 Tax=Bacillus sp. P14.5 TaxID=1983400 RepID=UPI000DEBBB3F|nr:C40 family peptidase [Bacillus sp. P14.5]
MKFFNGLRIFVLVGILLLTSENIGSVSAASASTDIEEYSKQFVGVPYSWGGTTTSGFDCSGFVTYVYSNYGVDLPRTSAGQYDSGTAINASELEKGDLVFFSTYNPGPSHTGIYLGDNEFIHAGNSGVEVSGLGEHYWKDRYIGARRYSEKISSSSLENSISAESMGKTKVYWDGLLMVDGQIGKVQIVKPINLWKRTDEGLKFERILWPGEQYRVYRYDNLYGGQYGLGGGYYVTNMDSYVSYKTPSKQKLLLLNGIN